VKKPCESPPILNALLLKRINGDVENVDTHSLQKSSDDIDIGACLSPGSFPALMKPDKAGNLIKN